MLLLTFHTGEALYAIDARQVVEVVPRVEARPLPHAPEFLVGMLRYRGRVVPLVDFGRLVGASASHDALSTRIVVAEFQSASGGPRRIGIVAERVLQVDRVRPDQVVLPDLELEESPYLGGMVQLDEGLAQFVRPDRLLPDRLCGSLHGDPAGPGP